MSTPEIVRLKIELDDTDPPVWRRIEVEAATTLKDLHPIVQAAMGWYDSHMHEFQLGRQRAPASTRLADLLDRGIKRFGYLYDMGDSWEHTLRIEKAAGDPDAACPRLIDGAGRCPPEDCGGIPGFYALLEALGDPDHPDHEEMLEWHGGGFDPLDMDKPEITQRLAQIAARRRRRRPKSKT